MNTSLRTKKSLPDMSYQSIMAFAGIVLGLALMLVNSLGGEAIILISYVGLTWKSRSLALMTYIVFAPFPLGGLILHHKIFLSDFMAIIMALHLFFETIRKSPQTMWDVFTRTPWRGPLLLLFALSLLSLTATLSTSGTIIKIMEYVEFFIVLIALFRSEGMNETLWARYFGVLFAIVSLVALFGVYQFLFGLGPTSNIVATYHVRADAFFGQPNPFGAFNEGTFPFLLGLLTFGSGRLKRGWLVVALFCVTLGVMVSYSRGSYVADAGAVFFMGVLSLATRGKKNIGRFALYGILVPVLMFGLTMLLAKLNLLHHPMVHVAAVTHHRSTLHRATSSVTNVLNPAAHYNTNQRLLIWSAAIQALFHHPITGVGLGNFHYYIQQHPPKGLAAIPPMAHDLYFEWGADLGIGGIIVALWLEWRWITVPIRILKSHAKKLNDFWYSVVIGAFGTMVSFIIHEWVDFMIEHGVVIPLVMAMSVVAVVSGHYYTSHRDKSIS